jgi:hypothetical protein
MISLVNYITIMLDHDHGMPLINKALQYSN